MRVAPAVFICLLCCVLSLPVSAGSACAEPTFRIDEFLAGPARDWDGSGAFSSRDDEWVELLNTGPASLDLAGFLLTDGDSLPRLALSGTLPPGARRVVFGREAFLWEQANGHPAFGLSLGNSGDSVLLWHITGTDTVLVDRYTYRSHEAATDRAVGRHPDTAAWTLYDGLNLYTGTLLPAGTGCEPTPNASNVCHSTPATPVSWGRIKTIYR